MARKTMPFKVGDLVVLKSGGPTMTVAILNSSSGNLWCTWFAGKKNERALFDPDALVPADQAKPSKDDV